MLKAKICGFCFHIKLSLISSFDRIFGLSTSKSVISNQSGFISDNVGLNDKNNDEFYYNKTTENPIGNDNDNNNYRAFKNKVTVKLINGKTVNKHIIHWCPSDNYFCITNSIFWDQFQKSIV